MKKLMALLLVSCLPLASVAQTELKGSPHELRQFLHPTPRTMTIHGDAEEKAYTDKAILSLVITTEKKTLSDSITANGNLRDRIKKQLINNGIKADAIKSAKFASSPQYGWFGKKPSKFEVVNRMAVSITQQNQLQAVAAIADKFPEVELNATTFEHTKKDQLNQLVKQKALDKILKQKAFYEKSLGIKLTPIGVRDSNIQRVATRGAKLFSKAMTPKAMRTGMAKPAVADKPIPAPTAPSFDEIKYRAKLSVDFKIEARKYTTKK